MRKVVLVVVAMVFGWSPGAGAVPIGNGLVPRHGAPLGI
jgi:hypothetical protein